MRRARIRRSTRVVRASSDGRALIRRLVFGDYCNGHIWSFKVVGGTVTNFVDRTAELAPGGERVPGSRSMRRAPRAGAVRT
jgi:hypothetical protein